MKYYEIVRFANQWPEMGEYEDVHNMVERGWTKKAVGYMSNWDYGDENVASAIALGGLRDTILDPQSDNDRIVKELDGYYLCESHCHSGLYDAYYLVSGINETELDR